MGSGSSVDRRSYEPYKRFLYSSVASRSAEAFTWMVKPSIFLFGWIIGRPPHSVPPVPKEYQPVYPARASQGVSLLKYTPL